jgi:hypothetical protein
MKRTVNLLKRVPPSHSFFVKRGTEVEYVKAGDRFRQHHDGRTSETAVVVSIGLDRQNIPHVRYRVRFQRGTSQLEGGARTMALKPFLRAYSERLPPPPKRLRAEAAE